MKILNKAMENQGKALRDLGGGSSTKFCKDFVKEMIVLLPSKIYAQFHLISSVYQFFSAGYLLKSARYCEIESSPTYWFL